MVFLKLESKLKSYEFPRISNTKHFAIKINVFVLCYNKYYLAQDFAEENWFFNITSDLINSDLFNY